MSESYPIKLEQDLIEEISRIETRQANTFFSLADYYVYRRDNNLLPPPPETIPETKPAPPSPTPEPEKAADDAKPDTGPEDAAAGLSLDGIRLTPIKKEPGPPPGPAGSRTDSTAAAEPPASLPEVSTKAGNLPDSLESTLKPLYQDLDESFMYLGVLKKIPLPDAMKLFVERFDAVVSVLASTWESGFFPEDGALFASLGEDHEQIKTLVHAEDAIGPIRASIRKIHDTISPLRENGAGWPKAEALLRDAFSSWQ